METGNQRQQRRRIPVILRPEPKFLAGSCLSRGVPKSPQGPPKAKKPRRRKIALPSCPHLRTLSDEEFAYQSNAKASGRDVGFWFVTECPRCFPDCMHEYKELTREEIASGRRWSARCPGCNGSAITDKAAWSTFLKFWGLSEYRAMSPAKCTVKLKNGKTIIFGQQKNYCTGGGSRDMEHSDARSNAARSDLPAQGSNWQQRSTDTYMDEQIRSNELNEPVSPVPSTFVAKAEHIKSASITEFIKGQLADPVEEIRTAPDEARPENPLENVMPDVPEVDKESEGMNQLRLSRKDKQLFKEILVEMEIEAQQ